MFTGLVQGTGTITAIDQSHGDPIFTIETPLDLSHEKIGASICCAGVCLTALTLSKHSFTAQAGFETLNKTTVKNWALGTTVNLEPSLRVGDPLGGHIVTGHVDGIATLNAIEPIAESYLLRLTPPAHLLPFIATKGSIAIDGISLTVAKANTTSFDIMVIPHTWAVTTLKNLTQNSLVNIEVDPLARYIARRLEYS